MKTVIMMTSLLTKTMTEYGNDEDDDLCNDFNNDRVMGIIDDDDDLVR